MKRVFVKTALATPGMLTTQSKRSKFLSSRASIFICWAQTTFGLLQLESSVIDFYPVELNLLDFVNVSIIVIIIGLIASWYPVRILTKKYL